MIRLGLQNLLRTKLRTGLTVLGVVVGIGALASMVSFGTGIEKNVTEAFRRTDLFTSLFVTSGQVEEAMDAEGIAEVLKGISPPLTDSTVQAIRAIPGVEIAFPEIRFPVRLEMDGREARATLRGLPSAMGSYKPFSDLMQGEFFADDAERSAVIRWETLKKMGLLVLDAETGTGTAEGDSLQGLLAVAPDSLIGGIITVITAVPDLSSAASDPIGTLMKPGRVFREIANEFRLIGILKRSPGFSQPAFEGGIFVPIKAADSIPRLGFSSVWELLDRDSREGAYASVYVRVENVRHVEPVSEKLTDEMGLGVFSISDQLKEIRRGFFILDSILAAVGTVALFVAGLGIVNTMVMSILERTREIGIMKAIGASEGEIRAIFFAEATAIGIVGAIFGLILGWLVTRVANVIVNARFLPSGEAPVNLFHFPVWLILGAIGFSVMVSLIAGLYPASRAARVDPVKALRHD
jgi:putative ABC transport system permease protein